VVHLWSLPRGAAAWSRFTGLRVDAQHFEPERLFMLSVYLLVMGLLLGYLAEQQKHLRAEKALINRILSRVRVEAGLNGTMQQIFHEIISMYNASRLLVASQEAHGHRSFLGEVTVSANGTPSELRWLDSWPGDPASYLKGFPGEACYVSGSEKRLSVLAMDHDGNVLGSPDAAGIARLRRLHPFQTLVTLSFLFGEEWKGQVFLFNPSWRGEEQEELRFLLNVMRQVGPAIYNVYLLHRLRRRASAVERARVARELHDGAVQSLIAVEMQVDVLRRQAENGKPITSELGRIQGLLREEVLKLRELMQQLKSIDVDAQRLLGVLHDTVERFQRETGISARFVTDIEEVDMPQSVCRELLRIVQESLVNVRKHSGARHALVRLTAAGAKWNLTVEDDGKGFPFAGRLTQVEMEEMGRGPMIIKERVRLIAGELTVESNPGQGARLEVMVPRATDVAHEF
jgi:signal transduction histidine kinase